MVKSPKPGEYDWLASQVYGWLAKLGTQDMETSTTQVG